MKKFLNIAGIGVVLLLGVWIYRILFPNDEKLIQQLLAEAAETAAVKPDENPLFKIAGANKLVGFFSPDAVLKMDVAGVDTRTLDNPEDLRQAVTAARASLQEAKFQLHEVQVNVGPDSQSATAQLVAFAYLNHSGDPLVQELKIQLKKIDRRWKISRVETVKTLDVIRAVRHRRNPRFPSRLGALLIGLCDWLHSPPRPSPLGRENGPSPLDHTRTRVWPTTIGSTPSRRLLFPLPEGEGQGEGEILGGIHKV